jgi:hypothetical protein
LLRCRHGTSALLRRRNAGALRGALRGVPTTTPLPIKLLLATILLMSIEPAIATLDTGRCPPPPLEKTEMEVRRPREVWLLGQRVAVEHD